ncbi:hypothetical protein LP419_25515 [Massilia sp. H-1]|nr:hypothetical protein LP419_25515 [Massilia sp. H-1]
MRQTLTLPGQRELEQARAVIDSMDSSDSVSAGGSLSWQRSTDNTLSLSPDLYSSRATNARREQRRWVAWRPARRAAGPAHHARHAVLPGQLEIQA